MRCILSLLVPVMALAACVAALAQMPTYNLGRTPSAEEIRAWDFIGLDGKGLPPGSGTAKEGATIYARKCAHCHGPTGAEGPTLPGVANLWPYSGALPKTFPSLVGGGQSPMRLWDAINRGMPPKAEGSLSADEVYALTAFLLYRNRIIQETDVIDPKSLPKIQMPQGTQKSGKEAATVPKPPREGLRPSVAPE